MSMGASHFKSFENLNINILIYANLYSYSLHTHGYLKLKCHYYIKLLSLTNFIISLVCECHK